jgi:hypothetical protein
MPGSDRFRLFPVVECLPAGDGEFWCALPEPPWPHWLMLGAKPTADDIALLLYMLATYGNAGHGSQPQTPAQLAESGRRILPGGLSALRGDLRIDPSCCCGLETWRDWYALADTGTSPWLGHDPAPYAEREGEIFTLWADGGLGFAAAEPVASICFDHGELAAALRNVETALEGFEAGLRAYLRHHHPQYAEPIADNFVSGFVRPSH